MSQHWHCRVLPLDQRCFRNGWTLLWVLGFGSLYFELGFCFEISYLRSEIVWSGRTELNCRHEFPGLGCSRYTTPGLRRRRRRGSLVILHLPILIFHLFSCIPRYRTIQHNEGPRPTKWRLKNGKWKMTNDPFYPFTQTTCLISATTSTRSSWFFITASIDL